MLEHILQLMGCKRPFKKDGELSAKGYETYNKLIKIINTLSDMDIITPKEWGHIVSTLDKISSEPCH